MTTLYGELFPEAYASTRERVVLGDAFCGPDRFEYGVDTLIARLPKDPEDGDGHAVEIYVMAMPARFYEIRALPGVNSSDEPQAGFTLSTGSGMLEWVKETAVHITQGMVAGSSTEQEMNDG